MRDALSIMDQAIASAPLEDGRPRLEAPAIRELMGTVPNAVFERILEAVDSNRSADVITIANELLDAGNSPAQLARQAVRYLRNCVIAKIAGLTPDGAEGAGTELLQISSDEQRRAARSAALFSEEELTRFLQVALRTFDELGYRQEQRFHFELGLLKLVHLRRLLPVEEVLSRFPVPGGGSAGTTQTRVPANPATSSPSRSTTPPPVAVTKPVFSPFQADSGRKTSTPPAASPASVPATPRPAPLQEEVPASISVIEDEPIADITPTEVAADLLGLGSLPVAAVEPEASLIVSTATPAEGPTAEQLQRAATDALMNAKSQGSAADALSDAEWSIEAGEIRVQTELSKIMLPMVINPEADKIIRAALRSAGGGTLKLLLLPGAANASSAKKPRPARTGSAQAKVMEHPVVQQAQRLFNAEIRNVIDLREND